MWISITFRVLKAVYWAGGRDIIKAAVDDPDKRWDNIMMDALDRLLRK